ncbi:MAG: type I 3-dehydroquinate dehydratase [Lachnospiraceae bacterium]
MKSTVKIRGLVFGENTPKICVPMTSSTIAELINEVTEIKKTKADIVEWRVDYFEDVEENEKVLSAAAELRKSLGEMPVLFTFRTKKEGGEKEISKESYVNLNNCIAASGYIDAIDVELFTGDNECRSIISTAHKNGVKVIMSNHDFDKTPSKDEIESRLLKMNNLGADIPKIAVMPNSPEDILLLLRATINISKKLASPIITMSMGALGAVSRTAGEVFGSCMTFGTVKQASAPGQIDANNLYSILNALRLKN